MSRQGCISSNRLPALPYQAAPGVNILMITHRKLKCLILTGCVSLFIALGTTYGEEGWRTDFDIACAQSNIAMALSVPELKKLIEQCDRLQKVIEEQEETVRKVYLKRL